MDSSSLMQTRTVLAASQEFNLISRPSISKALVRILKLSLKVIPVVPFVAPNSCALRPPKHPLILSLKAIQVRLSNVPMVLDRPLQPPHPGQVSVGHDGVVNLLALVIEELGRETIPGVVYGSLAASDGTV
jgi:hypothetical protein